MQTNQENKEEIGFSDLGQRIQTFIKYLFSKWLIIGSIAFVGGLIGITYAWLSADKYEATTSFSIEEDQTGSAIGLAGIASQFGFNIGGSDNIFSGENLLSIMHSRRVIESALFTKVKYENQEQSLLNVYLKISKMRESMDKSKTLKSVVYNESQDPATYSRIQDSILLLVIDQMSKSVIYTQKPDKKLDLFTVTCTTKNETFSILLCKAIIEQVTQFYTETKTKKAKQTVEVLQDRTDSIYNAYVLALSGKARLADANLNPAFQLPIVGIQQKQTDATVLGTAYGELLKNLELAKFNLLRETPLIQIIDAPRAPLLNMKLGRLIGGIIVAFIFGVCAIFYYSLKFYFKDQQALLNKKKP